MEKKIIGMAGITLIGICFGAMVNFTTNHHFSPQISNAAKATPTLTPTLTPTIKPSSTPLPSPSPTISVTLVPTPTATPSLTPSITITPTGSVSCSVLKTFISSYCP